MVSEPEGRAHGRAPKPWRPTPALLARIPRHRHQELVTPPPHLRDGCTVDGVEMHPRVVAIADRLGIDLAAVANAVGAPEDTWSSIDGNSTVHLRGPIAAIVADDTGEVIALAARARALTLRRRPRTGAVKRATGGGVGSRFPQTVTDLLARLRAHGFHIEPKRPHYAVTHPRRGGHATVPRTPSDHHSIPNSVLQIRATFGIDIRDQPETVGDGE